jgi:alpha-maltose-1-phosphate synthase
MKELGILNRFYTSSYVASPLLQELAGKLGLTKLDRRFQKGLSSPDVVSNWRFELPEVLLRALIGNTRKVNDLVFRRSEVFDRYVSRKLAGSGAGYFWGYQGCSLYSLQKANALGIRSVCEMTVAHVPYTNAILQEEQKINPDWADSIDFMDFPSAVEERLVEEPQVASHVVAISSFLKQSLLAAGVPGHKISVLPLGFDMSKMAFDPETRPLENRPLRLLYAGRITQRKGVSYLLDAVRRFDRKDVELYIIGDIFGSGRAFRRDQDLYTYMPHVGQDALFRQYGAYDALVLPSLAEGFPLVNLEAMGAGLPVITTPNTNAAEILKDGENGFLVPVRDSEAIARAIEKIRNMDTATFHAMRLKARETAGHFTWGHYRDALLELMQSSLS